MESLKNNKESKLPSWAVNLRAMVKTSGNPQSFAKRLHDNAIKCRRPTLATKDLTDIILSAQRGNVDSMNLLMKDYHVYPFMSSFQKINTDDITKRPRSMSREMWRRIVNTLFPQGVEIQEKKAV